MDEFVAWKILEGYPLVVVFAVWMKNKMVQFLGWFWSCKIGQIGCHFMACSFNKTKGVRLHLLAWCGAKIRCKDVFFACLYQVHNHKQKTATCTRFSLDILYNFDSKNEGEMVSFLAPLVGKNLEAKMCFKSLFNRKKRMWGNQGKSFSIFQGYEKEECCLFYLKSFFFLFFLYPNLCKLIDMKMINKKRLKVVNLHNCIEMHFSLKYLYFCNCFIF